MEAPILFRETDPYYQPETAYSIEGKPIDASKINYVVIPLDYSGKAKLGDVAMVTDYNTGESVFAIIGEVGPAGKNNEVSIALARNLGYSDASGTNGVSGSFRVIYFAGTKRNWTNDNLQNQINEAGNAFMED